MLAQCNFSRSIFTLRARKRKPPKRFEPEPESTEGPRKRRRMHNKKVQEESSCSFLFPMNKECLAALRVDSKLDFPLPVVIHPDNLLSVDDKLAAARQSARERERLRRRM